MLDDGYALTESEKAAGVGSLLVGSYERSYYRTHSGGSTYPANHGKKWSTTELNDVARLFNNDRTIDYIANNKKRTCYSIAWQLYEMDFITENQREAIKSGLRKVEYRKVEYRKVNNKKVDSRIDYVEEICFLSDEEKKSLEPKDTNSTYLEKNKTYVSNSLDHKVNKECSNKNIKPRPGFLNIAFSVILTLGVYILSVFLVLFLISGILVFVIDLLR